MLSDRKIKRAIAGGQLKIDPFVPENLGPNGLDVCLGKEIWRMRDYGANNLHLEVDLSNPINIDLQEIYAFESCETEVRLRPFEFILATTIETVGTPYTGSSKDLAAFFRTRSTIARLGVTFDLTGMGDVGFNSKWTLEVFNFSPYLYTFPVGGRIGQMVFYEVGEVDSPYRGRYSPKEWTPKNMLPRVFSIPPSNTLHIDATFSTKEVD